MLALHRERYSLDLNLSVSASPLFRQAPLRKVNGEMGDLLDPCVDALASLLSSARGTKVLMDELRLHPSHFQPRRAFQWRTMNRIYSIPHRMHIHCRSRAVRVKLAAKTRVHPSTVSAAQQETVPSWAGSLFACACRGACQNADVLMLVCRCTAVRRRLACICALRFKVRHPRIGTLPCSCPQLTAGMSTQ